jgi:hypothetical protein
LTQWNFILSPTTASQDPSGDYTRRWIPEVAKFSSTNLVHRPWEATKEQLEIAGVILGETYPHRIVPNLQVERQQSVDATLEMRRKWQQFNSDRGYDLIRLANGEKTVVFTKKEYRIDKNGKLMNDYSKVVRQDPLKKRIGYKLKPKSKRATKAKNV